MTRATVGGINSEDNLWYPLAVNSQGIAQIDTSGIPQPLEWDTGFFHPFYMSSDEAATAIIDYERNFGWYARLGNIVFLKIFLKTRSCVLTNPRGNLLVGGVPFTWILNDNFATYAGAQISMASGFRDETLIWNMNSEQRNLVFAIRKFVNGTVSDMEYSLLDEHSEGLRNDLKFSYWGLIQSTDPAPSWVFRNGILQETDEIPTDTP